MPDYKTMYYALTAKVADAIDLLTEAMQQVELQFMLDQDDLSRIHSDKPQEIE